MCTILFQTLLVCLNHPNGIFWKAKLRSSGYKASPSFKPYLKGNVSEKYLPIWTLLKVLFKHIFINQTTFMVT